MQQLGAQVPEHLEPSAAEDAPPRSVELDALTLMVEAYIVAEGPKKGERLLRAAAEILDLRETRAEIVVEFLPLREAMNRERVRKRTRAWFRRCLPVWLSKLDLG